MTRQARTRSSAARAVPGPTWPLAAMTAGLALTVTAAVGLHTDRAAPTGFAITRPVLANPAPALPRGGLTRKGLAVTGPAARAAPAVPVRLSLPTRFRWAGGPAATAPGPRPAPPSWTVTWSRHVPAPVP